MLHEVGDVIDGKYRLLRLIGTGGMGAVYEGENLLIRRRVAIKILHAASTGNSDAIRRFEREAQAAGEIGNDHILEVLDLGSLPNGDRYLVMEYLDGETLASRIERHGRLTPAQISPIARQFLTALASAHAAGIIHRDLKPENIFILRTKAGRVDFVKLIDFGISKFSRPFIEGEQRMTRADAVLGTPVYMSPEQARGARETDVRSDIYSCGVILYEAVTGQVPFDGESFNDLMFKIALSDAPSPLTLVPSLDPDFAWIINRAIARDPNARFASAQEFAEALDEWMRKNSLTDTLALPLPSDAFPVRTPRAIAASADTLTLGVSEAIPLKKTGNNDSWARSKRETTVGRKRIPKVAVVSGAGLVALALGIVFMVRADPTPATVPAAVEPTTSAIMASATGAAIGIASGGGISPPPAGDRPPPPASAGDAPESALAASAAIPVGPARHDPNPKLNTMARSAPTVPASPPVLAEKPKPKAATASAKGFDLGY